VLQQFAEQLRALQPPALVLESVLAPVTEARRCSERDELTLKHQDLLTATGKHLIPWLRGLQM
jgi:hypothetical protein